MKLNKTTERLLLLNLILSTITHSMALKCFTKAVFSRGGGSDETWPLNGADTNDCADGETRCITVTGSFWLSEDNGDGSTFNAMYEVKKLRKCASTDLCDGAISESKLARLLKAFDETIKTDNVIPGDAATSDCCEGNYCNKLADEVLPTTAPIAPSSGYKTLRSIYFFVAMSLIIWFFKINK